MGELSHAQAQQSKVIPVSSSRMSSLTDVILQLGWASPLGSYILPYPILLS